MKTRQTESHLARRHALKTITYRQTQTTFHCHSRRHRTITLGLYTMRFAVDLIWDFSPRINYINNFRQKNATPSLAHQKTYVSSNYHNKMRSSFQELQHTLNFWGGQRHWIDITFEVCRSLSAFKNIVNDTLSVRHEFLTLLSSGTEVYVNAKKANNRLHQKLCHDKRMVSAADDIKHNDPRWKSRTINVWLKRQ